MKRVLFFNFIMLFIILSCFSQNKSNNMILIEGGTFIMGSPNNEAGRSNNESPQHQVTVNSFYMSKYEVTQKEFQEIMGVSTPPPFKGDNLPMYYVNWYNAIEYCNKLSLKEGLTPAYIIHYDQIDQNNYNDNDDIKWLVIWNRNTNGYRLPTEAEWEYACRAGTTTVFNTGASIPYGLVHFRKDAPANVGSYAPNSWGLFDMHGNIDEWCWDWYAEFPIEAQTNPIGAISGINRVRRGGNWFDTPDNIRSAVRFRLNPSFGLAGTGFRLVRNGQ